VVHGPVIWSARNKTPGEGQFNTSLLEITFACNETDGTTIPSRSSLPPIFPPVVGFCCTSARK